MGDYLMEAFRSLSIRAQAFTFLDIMHLELSTAHMHGASDCMI